MKNPEIEANRLVCDTCGRRDHVPPIVTRTKCPYCKDGSMSLEEAGVKIRRWT